MASFHPFTESTNTRWLGQMVRNYQGSPFLVQKLLRPSRSRTPWREAVGWSLWNSLPKMQTTTHTWVAICPSRTVSNQKWQAGRVLTGLKDKPAQLELWVDSSYNSSLDYITELWELLLIQQNLNREPWPFTFVREKSEVQNSEKGSRSKL